jgi:hypothetical protein
MASKTGMNGHLGPCYHPKEPFFRLVVEKSGSSAGATTFLVPPLEYRRGRYLS